MKSEDVLMSWAHQEPGWGSGKTRVLHHSFQETLLLDRFVKQPSRRRDSTLIGLLRLGLVKRIQTKPAMAIPTHSQVKKLKRLMTEKMSWEMAYIMDSKHWNKEKEDDIVSVNSI